MRCYTSEEKNMSRREGGEGGREEGREGAREGETDA